MAKMTISIPDEIKDQMNALDGVNWSGVAARAFAIEVKCKARIGDASEAIQRLRASRDAKECERRPEYIAAGIQWVMKDADYETLEECVGLNPEADHDEIKSIMAATSNPLFQPDGAISATAVGAWHQGVMSVWEEIKDKI
jgi:hypothetical protein